MLGPARVQHSILFYALVMAALVVYRPPLLFAPDGSPLPFGAGPGKTVLDLGTAAGVTAVLTFAAFTLVDLAA